MSDDGADEVKVFRRTEADDLDANAQSSHQLAEDKKEVAIEAELEVRPPTDLLGGKNGAFVAGAKPSPSFLPFLPTGLSPSYHPMMLMNPWLPVAARYPPTAMSPIYQAAAMYQAAQSPLGMQVCNELLRLASPGYSPLRQMNKPATMAPSTPRSNPLNQINQMQIPFLHSPALNPANSSFVSQQPPPQPRRTKAEKNREKHIKKPLNAFMWFMKENRPKLMEELNYKEKQSAELNKELGRRWHSLDKDQQQKYFELAKNDRERHKLEHPGWSARENYALNKKKKRKRDKSVENSEMKKCRAKFGVNNQEMWCKFCKRKKKCEFATSSSVSERGGSREGHDTGVPSVDAAHDSDSESEVGEDPMADEALQAVALQQESLSLLP